MKQRIQLDNPTHRNQVRDKIEADAALAKAKKNQGVIKFLPKGASSEFKKKIKPIEDSLNE
jgi:hypothetical protein